ncbi:photosystem II assembly protein Psb35 [Aerosakkonemataceae cyanobacterium BLCC-F167]|uniref:Photosystem II assembly protein Psb35 n=2 Tax=Floridanema TaxID=3396149 RepID=A0ABV4WF45_9CYAN
MSLLMEAATSAANNAANAPHFPVSAILVYVVGFIAAVTIGSIAWYNSKRPVGWEDKERPSVVPEVKKEETPGIGTPQG